MAFFSLLPLETQQAILDNLVYDKKSLTHRDRKNLLAPMRVNSFWFHYTADILWNTISRLEITFKHLGLDDDRRQLYVSKIRVLTLHTARIYFDLIENLKFHSLTNLMLRGDHMGILPFLQSNLKTFIFVGSFGLTRNELTQMITLCPNLRVLQLAPVALSNHRALVVAPNPDPVDSHALSSFVEKCRHLKSLTLGQKLPNSLVSAALTGLPPVVACQLEELVLHNVESESLPHHVQFILEACTSLHKFEIRRTTSGPLIPMATFLRGLATTLSLKHLRLDHDIVEGDVDCCIGRHDAPFEKLGSLALKGEMLPVSRFLSLSMNMLTRLQLVSLTYLNLVIGIDRHESWEEGIRFRPGPSDWQATPADMQALSTLNNLRSLSIRPININLTAPWMTDDYFTAWQTKFPHLQDLDFDIECPLSFSSVVALSNSHPALRICKLLWIQEIEDWRNLPSTNFVNLQRLKLNLVMEPATGQFQAFLLEKFNMIAGSMGMASLRLDSTAEDPYRRPGRGADELRVTNLDVRAATPSEG
ncbi:hypothetical protein E4T44_01469 [Aureobasidium sp. EXF-8845]|nr:hypothetical protein E4T44_01469 [Aureobasidium sp. EXF-8845]KAI4857115.1 hypothetical protein E4T45_01407 [Aureobasidium sp. EXF-8846]